MYVKDVKKILNENFKKTKRIELFINKCLFASIKLGSYFLKKKN